MVIRVKRIRDILFGGLKKQMAFLVLALLVLMAVVFSAVTGYQNRMLTDIVSETRTEQQQAISREK